MPVPESMRSTLRVLLASLLVAAFAAPVAAASSGGATQETISGVLEAIHVDEFATGREREDYALRTAHGVIPLEFADGGPDGDGGATVTVTGPARVGRSGSRAPTPPPASVSPVGRPRA